MVTITEDYCDFETAKLLKEKGFYGGCFSMYLTPKPRSGMGNPNEAKIAPHGRDSHYYEGYEYQCEAPTLQMAMKWLREVYKIDVAIFPQRNGYVFALYNNSGALTLKEMKEYSTYEQSTEAAIKYCLENLI